MCAVNKIFGQCALHIKFLYRSIRMYYKCVIMKCSRPKISITHTILPPNFCTEMQKSTIQLETMTALNSHKQNKFRGFLHCKTIENIKVLTLTRDFHNTV